jgi:multidrug efflux pump subunit AcrA (membrane-fusion protein)
MRATKMFKKLGLTALVLVVGIVLLGHTKVGRYLWSWVPVAADNVSSAFKAQITPEMELKRIKGEIGRLDGDIKRNFSKVAQAEVETDAFADEVKTAKANLDGRVKYLAKLDKEANDALFSREWDTYKIAEATLASKEKLLKQKQELVRLAKAKLDAMIAERDQLTTRVADLETKLEELRLAQTQCPVQVDDSRLGEIKTSLNEVDKQVKVMKKEVEFQSNFAPQEPTKVEVQVKGAQAREEFRARFGDKFAEK